MTQCRVQLIANSAFVSFVVLIFLFSEAVLIVFRSRGAITYKEYILKLANYEFKHLEMFYRISIKSYENCKLHVNRDYGTLVFI